MKFCDEKSLLFIISNSDLYLKILNFLYYGNGCYMDCYTRKQANNILSNKFNCSTYDLQFFWRNGLFSVYYLGGLFLTKRGMNLMEIYKEKEAKP